MGSSKPFTSKIPFSFARRRREEKHCTMSLWLPCDWLLSPSCISTKKAGLSCLDATMYFSHTRLDRIGEVGRRVTRKDTESNSIKTHCGRLSAYQCVARGSPSFMFVQDTRTCRNMVVERRIERVRGLDLLPWFGTCCRHGSQITIVPVRCVLGRDLGIRTIRAATLRTFRSRGMPRRLYRCELWHL